MFFALLSQTMISPRSHKKEVRRKAPRKDFLGFSSFTKGSEDEYSTLQGTWLNVCNNTQKPLHLLGISGFFSTYLVSSVWVPFECQLRRIVKNVFFLLTRICNFFESCLLCCHHELVESWFLSSAYSCRGSTNRSLQWNNTNCENRINSRINRLKILLDLPVDADVEEEEEDKGEEQVDEEVHPINVHLGEQT